MSNRKLFSACALAFPIGAFARELRLLCDLRIERCGPVSG
jgi:hypothetical protein